MTDSIHSSMQKYKYRRARIEHSHNLKQLILLQPFVNHAASITSEIHCYHAIDPNVENHAGKTTPIYRLVQRTK